MNNPFKSFGYEKSSMISVRKTIRGAARDFQSLGVRFLRVRQMYEYFYIVSVVEFKRIGKHWPIQNSVSNQRWYPDLTFSNQMFLVCPEYRVRRPFLGLRIRRIKKGTGWSETTCAWLFSRFFDVSRFDLRKNLFIVPGFAPPTLPPTQKNCLWKLGIIQSVPDHPYQAFIPGLFVSNRVGDGEDAFGIEPSNPNFIVPKSPPPLKKGSYFRIRGFRQNFELIYSHLESTEYFNPYWPHKLQNRPIRLWSTNS